MQHGFARQMVRQWAADGLGAGSNRCLKRCRVGQGRIGTRGLVLGLGLFQIFEAQFELRDLGIQAL